MMLWPSAFCRTTAAAASDVRPEFLHLTGRHRTIERIGGGNGADEDEHDQPHALLAVVGAMGERDAGAGGDERAADPPRRRLIALRRLIERWIADDELQRQEQQSSRDKAEQRREQQRVADLGRLGPIDARGAVLSVHQRVGDADADDRPDQRMRA